jgi:two-component system response regulator TctD
MDDPDPIYPDPDILWSQIRESERTAPADRPVVLVIEDDASTRMLMRHALREVVRTDAASTVADALRMAETLPYDGLLVDLRLPDGEGTEVVDELRGRTPYWGVPMVAVTGHSLPDGSGHYLDAGFDAYLAKPFEPEDLRTLVRHLVVEGDEAVDEGRKLMRQDASPPVLSGDEEAEDDSDERREPPATKRLDPLPEN